MAKVLTKEGRELQEDFENEYADRSCSCHINPPCGYCTHPGNPISLEESPDLWEEEQDWYFTFGCCTSNGNRYVKIYGTRESTREEMFRRFGKRWSMQYNSPISAGIEKYGLTELK